ncbi:MAG: MBL fold metallo-hydrolase [Myxococcales bacterium]
MRIHALDGNRQWLDGGAMFGNAPRTVWQTWCPPDERHRIPLACRCMFAELDDGRRVLFEAGIGAFFEPKLRDRYGVVEPHHVLLESLAHAGLAEDSIDAIVLSHLHFDHAGGLLSAYDDGPARLLFPKARIYIGHTHWRRALAPHPRDRASFLPELNALLAKSDRVVLVGDDAVSDLAPFVRFHFSQGHTPGLMLSELDLTSGPLVFVADLIPGLPWVHLPITMGYDRSPEVSIDEKTKLLEDLVARHGRLFFFHDPDVACAEVTRDGKGRFAGAVVTSQGEAGPQTPAKL